MVVWFWGLFFKKLFVGISGVLEFLLWDCREIDKSIIVVGMEGCLGVLFLRGEIEVLSNL